MYYLLLFACVAIGVFSSLPIFLFLHRRRSEHQPRIRALLRLALTLGVALLIAEACARLVMAMISADSTQQTTFDAELGWSRPPGNRVVVAGDVPSASNDVNVVFVGDSVAFGHGVAPESGMVHQTRLLLRSRGRSVLNAAVSGYGIDQTYLYVKRHLPAWDNAEVLVYVLFAGNDFEDTASNMRYGHNKPLFRSAEDGRLKEPERLSRFSRRNLVSESRLVYGFEALFPSFSSFVDGLCGHVFVGGQETQRVVHALLVNILQETRAHDVKTILVLLPARVDFTAPGSSYLRLERALHESGGSLLSILPLLHSRGINDDSFFLAGDPWHLSPEGNRITADLIAEKILDLPPNH